MLGPGNLLNEGIRSYIQVSYDFIQDSNRKPVLTGPPFTISLISHPLPYGYPPCLVLMERYFQGLSLRENYVARGPFSTGNVGIYRITATNTYCQYISTLSEITPIWTSPLPLFKFYDSSPSILRVLEVVLR